MYIYIYIYITEGRQPPHLCPKLPEATDPGGHALGHGRRWQIVFKQYFNTSFIEKTFKQEIHSNFQ